MLLLLIEIPIESEGYVARACHQSQPMRHFEGQRLGQLSGLLGQLSGLHGVSMDVGYIGYFTHARLCDMSGFVNGRAVARLGPSFQ